MSNSSKSKNQTTTKVVQKLTPVKTVTPASSQDSIITLTDIVFGKVIIAQLIYDSSTPKQVTLVLKVDGHEFTYFVVIGMDSGAGITINDFALEFYFSKWEIKADSFSFEFSLDACAAGQCVRVWVSHFTVPAGVLNKDRAQFQKFLRVQREVKQRQIMPKL